MLVEILVVYVGRNFGYSPKGTQLFLLKLLKLKIRFLWLFNFCIPVTPKNTLLDYDLTTRLFSPHLPTMPTKMSEGHLLVVLKGAKDCRQPRFH